MILVLLGLGILALVAVVATVLSVTRDGYGDRREPLPRAEEWSDLIR